MTTIPKIFITLSLCLFVNVVLPAPFENSKVRKSRDANSDDGPAAKCQDIYERDKNSPSGYYDIKIGDQIFKVYCYFHNPQSTMIRQFDDVNGVPQEFHVYEPVGVSNGDPEGAMEMQVEPHEIPPGAGPHFTQSIIDEQEKMYWNKTATIQNLINSNNEREREKKKENKNPDQDTMELK
ncbi:uncharacterized protein LOC135688971 isoform X2 [Rhopilema esculentum]|uniref:uncharacterized protein LOC135688971 isoform X2 n=1 Tax=Rhopilema esculentum TaxID=499914 RepID=UPI0031D26F82